MSKDKPSLGRGNVTIDIGGVDYTLKPSLGAIQRLSKKYGGLNVVLDHIAKLDFEAVCDVIEVGIGRFQTNPKQRQELAEAIYEAGLTDDTGKVGAATVRYILVLMRGGRPLSEEDEAALQAAANGDAPSDPGNSISSSES